MTLIDYIAILGALAWTPPLISLIKNILQKPVIRVFAPQIIEVGYSTFGTILNINLAFSVKNKDIVISSIKILLTHENGDRKEFEWQTLNQQIMKRQNPDGSIHPYHKEQSTLALKLNTKDIEERTIRFQESSFLNESTRIGNIIYKDATRNYMNAGILDTQNLMRSQNVLDFFELVQHNFAWKAGTYTISISLESPENFVLLDNNYEFTLPSTQVESLRKNQDFIESHFIEILYNTSPSKIHWHWSYPSLTKKPQ